LSSNFLPSGHFTCCIVKKLDNVRDTLK
jgi:hypothetical protein